MCQVEGAESKEDKRTMDVIDSGHEGLLDPKIKEPFKINYTKI